MNAERICASLQHLPDDMIAQAMEAGSAHRKLPKWLLPVAACLILLLALPFVRNTAVISPTQPPEQIPSDTEAYEQITKAELHQYPINAYVPDLAELGLRFELAGVVGKDAAHMDIYQVRYSGQQMRLQITHEPTVGFSLPWWVDLRKKPPSTEPLQGTPVFLEEQFSMEALSYLRLQKPNSGIYHWNFAIKLEDGSFVCYSISAPSRYKAKAIFEKIVELFTK